MQGAISQETLLEILQQGEVLPPGLDIEAEITRTRDMLEEQAAREALAIEAQAGSGLEGGNVGQGDDINSQTLPTPMRPGKNPA
jgi:hypothetical protein